MRCSGGGWEGVVGWRLGVVEINCPTSHSLSGHNPGADPVGWGADPREGGGANIRIY